MNDPRTQAMARAYVEEGLSYAQIGERFDLTRQRVGQLLGPLELARDQGSVRKAAREQRLRSAHTRLMAGELTLLEVADELGYASRESLRSAFHDLGLKSGVAQPIPPHGTVNRYRSRREPCRCEECRRANREYNAALRGREPPTHGASGYVNYGCRCKRCKEAHRRMLRARRAAKRGREVNV